MNPVRYTCSLVKIYWWKYYDLLIKLVDPTDSDHIFKKCNFVSFIFHICIVHPLPICIYPSSIHSPSSFIHNICFLFHWGLNPSPWGSEPDALTITPWHQVKKLSWNELDQWLFEYYWFAEELQNISVIFFDHLNSSCKAFSLSSWNIYSTKRTYMISNFY